MFRINQSWGEGPLLLRVSARPVAVRVPMAARIAAPPDHHIRQGESEREEQADFQNCNHNRGSVTVMKLIINSNVVQAEDTATGEIVYGTLRLDEIGTVYFEPNDEERKDDA